MDYELRTVGLYDWSCGIRTEHVGQVTTLDIFPTGIERRFMSIASRCSPTYRSQRRYSSEVRGAGVSEMIGI